MSIQNEFNALFDAIHTNSDNSNQINELKNSFDENHIEIFLEKLTEIEDIDALLDYSEQSPEITNQFLDFVSELIINQ